VAWITVIGLTYQWARVVWSRTIVQLAAEEQRRRIVGEQQSTKLLDTLDNGESPGSPDDADDPGTPMPPDSGEDR